LPPDLFSSKWVGREKVVRGVTVAVRFSKTGQKKERKYAIVSLAKEEQRKKLAACKKKKKKPRGEKREIIYRIRRTIKWVKIRKRKEYKTPRVEKKRKRTF